MSLTGKFGVDAWKSGDHKAVCHECGRVFLRSEMRTRWDKAIVCLADWEPRQPQDYVRARRDQIRVDSPSPEPAEVFLTTNQVTPESL